MTSTPRDEHRLSLGDDIQPTPPLTKLHSIPAPRGSLDRASSFNQPVPGSTSLASPALPSLGFKPKTGTTLPGGVGASPNIPSSSISNATPNMPTSSKPSGVLPHPRGSMYKKTAGVSVHASPASTVTTIAPQEPGESPGATPRLSNQVATSRVQRALVASRGQSHSARMTRESSNGSDENMNLSNNNVDSKKNKDKEKEKPKPVPKVVKPAMTPAETMKKFGEQLTPFEQTEILEYQQIYFVGNTKDKIRGIPHTPNNNGYDDDRGDYKLIPGDHLEYRYEVMNILGRGSFGQVVKVLDHKKDQILALKIIRNKKRFHHQALVEVKILEHLMGKDRDHRSNIVRVHGYFYFRNHLCITFELLSINLYEFIKNNNFKGISLGLIRRFAIQMLTSLKFLRKEKIIHCDLKPENVLLKAPNKSTIRLIDFGSSCFEDERVYTYIQSRFYRSPEVILGLPYDLGIDMWSFGCILSELYTGYPLFPGENETEQMQCIMEILGPPPKRLIQECTRKKAFFDPTGKPLIVPNTRGKVRHPGTKDLTTATKCNDPQFISFLRRCLRWDPKVRLTPDKAFEHPWIAEALKPNEGGITTPSIIPSSLAPGTQIPQPPSSGHGTPQSMIPTRRSLAEQTTTLTTRKSSHDGEEGENTLNNIQPYPPSQPQPQQPSSRHITTTANKALFPPISSTGPTGTPTTTTTTITPAQPSSTLISTPQMPSSRAVHAYKPQPSNSSIDDDQSF